MSALDDRRQAAREAFHDERDAAGVVRVEHGLDEAIETATRVRITPEMIDQAMENSYYDGGGPDEVQIRHLLKAAFEAAGFEVEE